MIILAFTFSLDIALSVTKELIQTVKVTADRECASSGEKMEERSVTDPSIFQ